MIMPVFIIPETKQDLSGYGSDPRSPGGFCHCDFLRTE